MSCRRLIEAVGWGGGMNGAASMGWMSFPVARKLIGRAAARRAWNSAGETYANVRCSRFWW